MRGAKGRKLGRAMRAVQFPKIRIPAGAVRNRKSDPRECLDEESMAGTVWKWLLSPKSRG